MAIRILVVDDHHVVRCGIRDFLEHHADLDLVGEARTAEESLALIDELQPDVVLMDIRLPGGMNGIEATAEVTARYPAIKVIAIAGLHQNAQFRRVMKAGACGYLLKAIASDEMADAIRKAHAGEELLPAEIVGPLLDDSQIELTDRELEVLSLIARGLTNRQIANILDMSIHTAQFHVRNIRAKLGAKNNAEVTSIAVRQGLLDLS